MDSNIEIEVKDKKQEITEDIREEIKKEMRKEIEEGRFTEEKVGEEVIGNTFKKIEQNYLLILLILGVSVISIIINCLAKRKVPI